MARVIRFLHLPTPVSSFRLVIKTFDALLLRGGAAGRPIMMRSHLQISALVLALAVFPAGLLHAQMPHPGQPTLPLSPPVPRGGPIVPYFDGWFQNPDGSRTFS